MFDGVLGYLLFFLKIEYENFFCIFGIDVGNVINKFVVFWVFVVGIGLEFGEVIIEIW